MLTETDTAIIRAKDWTPTEALYAFVGWLTTRPVAVVIGAEHETPIAVELMRQFLDRHQLPPDCRPGWERGIVPESALPVPQLDPHRCAVCGWGLVEKGGQGCWRGNCSMRPRPKRLYDPDRAKAEAIGRCEHGVPVSAECTACMDARDVLP